MYELSHVTKNYQKGRRTVSAVRDLSLTVDDGEWLAVQGRTGHGKSTLLHLLGGLDRPSSGTVAFDGRDLSELPESKLVAVRCESFGYVFQTFNLVPTLSAAENVEAALVPMRVRGPERRRRVAAALESVGLTDRMRHVPSELSGGQQQRVAIARAIVKEPKVLLADEPTGNLDEETRDDIIGLLEKLWLERGLTMILITHDSAVAKRAQRVGVMKNGNLSILRDSRRAQARRGQRADADRGGPAAVGADSAGESITEPEPAG
jgi:putative ABC transport system ATP-binding protein